MGWLLPRPMPVPPLASDRLYDNADSFAQSFDAAWKALGNSPEDANHRIDLVLDQLRDHPFMISRPAMARQVADFRIRLLGL
jgi:hypothetical protein